MSSLGLDHVQLAAPGGCEGAARRFYGCLLGLEEITKPEPLRSRGGVWFRLEAQQLHIGVEEAFTPARKAHPAIVVDPGQLATISERLRSAGATVIWDDAIPGARRFYTEDPWGNRLELLEPASPRARRPPEQRRTLPVDDAMAPTLTSPPVVELLHRLHEKADREDAAAERRVQDREAEVGHRLPAPERYELYGDAPLSISRDVGELYYLLTATRRPRNIVEFGTSHGISTIYLAAGLRDGGEGSIISTEILPGKAELARQNLVDANLDDLVDVRVGDALETLRNGPAEADMVVLDGRNDQYVPVLELLGPRLSPGALIVADLGTGDPDLLAYQHHVRRPGSGFVSLQLPLDAGLELTVLVTG